MEKGPDGRVLQGFAAALGIRVQAWPEGAPHLVLDLKPEFLNRNGAIHGGVILSLLDSVCSVAACRYENGRIIGRVVMVSLTTNFIAPAVRGALHGHARVRGGGKTLVIADGEIRDDAGALIATGMAVVRRIRDE